MLSRCCCCCSCWSCFQSSTELCSSSLPLFALFAVRNILHTWKSVESINANRNRCSLNISHCYYTHFLCIFILNFFYFFSLILFIHSHLLCALFIAINPVFRMLLLPFALRDQILWRKCELLVNIIHVAITAVFFLLSFASNKQHIKLLVNFFFLFLIWICEFMFLLFIIRRVSWFEFNLWLFIQRNHKSKSICCFSTTFHLEKKEEEEKKTTRNAISLLRSSNSNIWLSHDISTAQSDLLLYQHKKWALCS